MPWWTSDWSRAGQVDEDGDLLARGAVGGGQVGGLGDRAERGQLGVLDLGQQRGEPARGAAAFGRDGHGRLRGAALAQVLDRPAQLFVTVGDAGGHVGGGAVQFGGRAGQPALGGPGGGGTHEEDDPGYHEQCEEHHRAHGSGRMGGQQPGDGTATEQGQDGAGQQHHALEVRYGSTRTPSAG